MYRQISSLHYHRRTVHALAQTSHLRNGVTTTTRAEEIVEMPPVTSPMSSSSSSSQFEQPWSNAYLSDSVRTAVAIPVTLSSCATSPLVQLPIETAAAAAAAGSSAPLPSSPIDFPLVLNWTAPSTSASTVDDLTHACLAFDTASNGGHVIASSASTAAAAASHLLGADHELSLGLEMSPSSPFGPL